MKTIIVEGKTDKHKLHQMISEPVDIICTHGTLGVEELDRLVEDLEGKDVYVLVDADDAGNKLREQLKREFPNATHLYTRKVYKEVARTPDEYLAQRLADANFDIKEGYLLKLFTESAQHIERSRRRRR